MMRRLAHAAATALVVLLLGGCGDDDGGGGAREATPTQRLKDAVAKTEAARTARMSFDISIDGSKLGGDAVVDFEHDRDLLTMTVEGRTVQLFSDGGAEYVREGTSGRFRPFPASQQSPVANNPADSLRYVGTDVVDVKEAGGEGCLQGKLDFERVIARAEPGREGELPDELRGAVAPVTVCVDDGGRIVRYDVELSVERSTVEVRSTITDHGRAPALEPLGPDERPR